MDKLRSGLVTGTILGIALLKPIVSQSTEIIHNDIQRNQVISSSLVTSKNTASIDAKADNILREMSSLLESNKQFSFTATATRDFLTTNGIFLQLTHNSDIFVDKPNQLQASVDGDVNQLEFWYDGEEVTVLDINRNLYATKDTPDSNIDDTLDFLDRNTVISLPLTDFLYSNPYQVLTEKVKAGSYLGLRTVNGISCHHLVFTQDNIDWQIWIEDNENPVPHKFAIAYKNLPGVPRYTAIFSNWNLKPQLNNNIFTPSLPEDAKKSEESEGAE